MIKEKEADPIAKYLTGITLERYNAAPQEGTAEIRLRDPKKTGTLVLRGYIDPPTRQRVKFIDETGEDRQDRISKKKVLYMNIPLDRLEYVVAKYHPEYTLKDKAPLLVICVQEEAKGSVTKREMALEAGEVLRKLTGRNLRSFARVLVTSPDAKAVKLRIIDTTTDEVIKSHLYDIMDENPNVVLKEWKDPRRKFREMVRDGLDEGVFKERGGVYNFGEMKMGITFDQAVEWLANEKNAEIMPNIEMSIYGKKTKEAK